MSRFRFVGIVLVLVPFLFTCQAKSASPMPQLQLTRAQWEKKVAQAPDLTAVIAMLSGDHPQIRQALTKLKDNAGKLGLKKDKDVREFLLNRAEVLWQMYADYPTAQQSFRAGQRLEKRGYATEAHRQYLEATKKDPKSPEAWAAVGRTAYKSGKTDEAITAYQRALKLAPKRPGWHLELGDCYYNQDKSAQAKAEFQQAVKLKPDFAKAYERLATVNWRQKNYKEALDNVALCRKHGGEPNIQLVNLIRQKLGLPPEKAKPKPGEHVLTPGTGKPAAQGQNPPGQAEPPASLRRPDKAPAPSQP